MFFISPLQPELITISSIDIDDFGMVVSALASDTITAVCRPIWCNPITLPVSEPDIANTPEPEDPPWPTVASYQMFLIVINLPPHLRKYDPHFESARE